MGTVPVTFREGDRVADSLDTMKGTVTTTSSNLMNGVYVKWDWNTEGKPQLVATSNLKKV
jgi:hypothetical protein